jgi:hypothetical protein
VFKHVLQISSSGTLLVVVSAKIVIGNVKNAYLALVILALSVIQAMVILVFPSGEIAIYLAKVCVEHVYL